MTVAAIALPAAVGLVVCLAALSDDATLLYIVGGIAVAALLALA